MSKMDALRAMREERYEQAQRTAAGGAARAAQPARRTTAATRPPVAPPATDREEKATDASAPEPVEALCGHKNMGGRSCTRPAGHSEKSHRYS
ncbi:hypothetical protein G7072_05965 [Nocardioides sp. HDW12B]|uniref:hypothetical protein n=1 Tax=Nocardioides sp. HDW12B TaxID=2714939 RepID=UPI0014091CAF|nr:hypothetical protein [Nocardioides sp. HDW12B]QIK65943.1 hypothetical protein G7072_05965 [Nocardioides sp. HDW12B]